MAAGRSYGKAVIMDISRLKYFVVTAEERSISRAAERLHITQPPLTRHIQSLEKELGVSLFKRTSGGVELTEAGKAVLSHARAIRTQVEQATEQVRKVARGQAGRIDIGVYGSAMLDSIPKILGAYSSSHPDVEVVLHVASRGRQIESLHRGRLLIAFDDHGLDGMRTDVKGNLYIARYGAGVVAVVSPDGRLLREVKLKGQKPTNVAFGGPDGRTIFVTLQDRGAIEALRAEHPGREAGL